MTKEEVLRGLEICKSTNKEDSSCFFCPYCAYSTSCITALMDDAYKLLKTEVVADE